MDRVIRLGVEFVLQILRVLNESAVAVRTKAMKCLTAVVEADPGILARVGDTNYTSDFLVLQKWVRFN